MNTIPTKKDLHIVSLFEKNVKNINELLAKRSLDEIKEFFASQNQMLNTISSEKIKKPLLAHSKELRDRALENKERYDSVFERLINVDTLIVWKNQDDVIQFFDEIDNDISKIHIQNLRHLLLSKSDYFRKSKLDDLRITSVQNTFRFLDNDYKVAWETQKEAKQFFDDLSDKIKKIANKEVSSNLSAMLNLHKMSVLNNVEAGEFIPAWLQE